DDESLQRHQDLSDLWLRRAIERAAAVNVRIASHPRAFEDARPRACTDDVYAQTTYCRYPFFHLSMNSGGEIMPCPFAHGEAPYGTAGGDAPIEAIWLGPRFSRLRGRILAHDPPGMCRRCAYLASRYPGVETLFQSRAPAVATP